MAERDSWATQNSGPTGILDVEDARLALGTLWTAGASAFTARTGFRVDGTAGWGFVFPTGTPNGFVHVAPFQLVLQTVRASAGGTYLCTLDAQKDVNILSTPADGTNPRDDLVIARQTDTFYADGSSAFAISQIVGTPAGSPSDPTVTGSQDYIPLARVRVNASATTITGANITDLRTAGHAKSLTGGLFTVATGGVLPVDSLAQRSAVVGLYNGFPVWRRDLFGFNVYDGSGWRYYVRPSNATVATSETTTSGSYVDLTTPGPAVTVETGTVAEVTVGGHIQQSAAGITSYMTYAVSGATTVAAADLPAVGVSNNAIVIASRTTVVTGLTPGSNVFTAKYKVNGAGTGTFMNRTIHVRAC